MKVRNLWSGLLCGLVTTIPICGAAENHKPLVAPAHTYSIVARDAATGQLGVAVQSHWFRVGTDVAWAEAGVGAVATQSFIDPGYGPRGLLLMGAGHSAVEALAQLIEGDESRDVRQVAMVDARGRVAGWTGKNCIIAAGDQQGDGFSVQANLMDNARVWPAMARAFEDSQGQPLAERLLLALEAAEDEGGDIRGRQSAALLVVRAKGTGQPWLDRVVDLRVDDAAEPLKELRRLLGVHHAYEAMNAGDAAMTDGDGDAAMKHYSRAAELLPDNREVRYWQAVTLFTSDQQAKALEILREVFQAEPRWIELTRRLPASGLLTAQQAEKILSAAPGNGPEE